MSESLLVQTTDGLEGVGIRKLVIRQLLQKKEGSNFVFFAALYCSCLGLLHCLQARGTRDCKKSSKFKLLQAFIKFPFKVFEIFTKLSLRYRYRELGLGEYIWGKFSITLWLWYHIKTFFYGMQYGALKEHGQANRKCFFKVIKCW